jgi:hypothetical protein
MSPSKSPNKSFYRAFGIVVGGLSVGILILALLVTTSGPRVRHVVVQSPGANGGVASVNQGLTVVFDRPIESSSDFENAVNIQPKTDYTVSHRNQQLNITFDQNLLSNTDYVLTINPLLEDDLGKQMESEYTYEFSTAEPSFTYLERNYDPGAVDKIIERSPLSGESQILFGADKIKLFGRTANYLAVVLPRADSTDELRVVDLDTVEERTLDIPSNTRIDNLKFSPTENQFVFAARPIRTTDTSESSEEDSGNTLYRYDIDSDQLQPIADMGEGGEVDTVLYSSDGQALLYQTLDREYYLTGAAQDTQPILLGKYGPTGGFDRTNNKLTFIDGANAMIYDAQAKEEREVRNIQIGGRITTPMFLHNSDELLYLREPIGEKELQVYTADADGNLEQQVVETQPPAQFFDEPVVSYDDRYVLIEATFEPQGDDRYVGHSKPKDARLVLYDQFDHKVIDPGNLHGIDPVWNR